DLVVTRRDTTEGVFFVLKNPSTGRYFRFREPEYAIARRLDGATPVETVRVLVSAEFGAEIEPDDMAAFVAELARQGLLTGETKHGPVIRHETPLCAGSAVWLRFRAYDPDRLLDRLLPAVRFCFTPPFVAVAA